MHDVYGADFTIFLAENDVDPCCHQRDACMQTCGSAKATCSKNFETCTTELCKQRNVADPEGEESCKKSAKYENNKLCMRDNN